MHHTTWMLDYAPPFNWPAMLGFFRNRAIPGVELVTDNVYSRTITLEAVKGWLILQPAPDRDALQLDIFISEMGLEDKIVSKVRQLMDLDAPMEEIIHKLSCSPKLTTLVKQYAGTRLPGCWDVFEFSVRAILGQQISVKAATTLAGRITHAYGEQSGDLFPDGLSHFFPSAEVLSTQDFEGIGLTRSRKATLMNLAKRVSSGALQLNADNGLEDFVHRLVQEPGIGPWTAHYLAMRGLSQPDAFPASDLGIIVTIQHPSYKSGIF